MGLILGLLTLPIAPVRATIAIADKIRQEAIREFYDPARIRQQLDEVARLRSSGAIDDDEADAWEQELVDRLVAGRALDGGR